MFAFMHYAHARAALALATATDSRTKDRSELIGVARSDARRIQKNCANWSLGLVELTRAGVATFHGEATAVRGHLLHAETALLKVDLTGFAMAATWHRSAYEAPNVGERIRGVVRDWAQSQGVKRVNRLAACLAPGRYRHA